MFCHRLNETSLVLVQFGQLACVTCSVITILSSLLANLRAGQDLSAVIDEVNVLTKLCHIDATVQDHGSAALESSLMPSLIRFIIVIGTLGGLIFGTLYALAEYFEPEQKEVSKPVLGVQIKR